MAATLSLLGRSSAFKPLYSCCPSLRHAPYYCMSQISAVPSLCQASSIGIRNGRSVKFGSQLCDKKHSSQVIGIQYENYLLELCRSTKEQELLPPDLRSGCQATALAVATVLVGAGASLADEVAAGGAVTGAGVGEMAGNGTIAFLFVAASIGLVILTGGVIYLSVQDFLEKRALETESKKVKEETKNQNPKVGVKAGRVGGPKGFGSKRVKDDDEE